MILCFRWFSLSNYYKTEIVTWKTWNVTISRVWGSRLGAATKNGIVTWVSLVRKQSWLGPVLVFPYRSGYENQNRNVG